MRLGASVAFALNSLAQGPVTRRSCRRRESNPELRDSRPDALATLPPRFARANLTILACCLTLLILSVPSLSKSVSQLTFQSGKQNHLEWVSETRSLWHPLTMINGNISN